MQRGGVILRTGGFDEGMTSALQGRGAAPGVVRVRWLAAAGLEPATSPPILGVLPT